MQEFYNKHYIRLDDASRITAGFSDAFEQPELGDICINEQAGYQFRLYEAGEENPQLYDYDGVPLYKYEADAVIKRTETELSADRQPTQEELQQIYENLSIQHIHDRYTYDEENKIIREYLSDQINEQYKAAFDSYNAYVLECKQRAHTQIYGDSTQ